MPHTLLFIKQLPIRTNIPFIFRYISYKPSSRSCSGNKMSEQNVEIIQSNFSDQKENDSEINYKISENLPIFRN